MLTSEVVLVKGEALMDTVPPPCPSTGVDTSEQFDAPIGYGSRPVEIYVFSGTDRKVGARARHRDRRHIHILYRHPIERIPWSPSKSLRGLDSVHSTP